MNIDVTKYIQTKDTSINQLTEFSFKLIEKYYDSVRTSLFDFNDNTSSKYYPLSINKIEHTYSSEKEIKVEKNDNIYSILTKRLEENPKGTLFKFKKDINKADADNWDDINIRDFIFETKTIAKGLIAKGYRKGDTIGIIARTSFEWVVLNFAILSIGCISVPISPRKTETEISMIIQDSETRLIVVENQDLSQKLNKAIDLSKMVVDNASLDKGFLEELKFQGKQVSDQKFEIFNDEVKSQDTATYLYPYLAESNQVGVVYTHHAILSQAYNSSLAMETINNKDTKALFFLALSQAFGYFSLFALICSNAKITLGNKNTINQDLRTTTPDFILSTPHLVTKMLNDACSTVVDSGKESFFELSFEIGIQYSKALESENGVPLQLKFLRDVYDKLLFNKIRSLFGDNLKYIICGGNSINSTITHFLRGIGISLLEGYGLSETGSAIFVSRTNDNSIGSFGFPLASTKYKIAKDGELLVKTDTLFSKYLNNEKATKAKFYHDWYKTGDLVLQNSNGSLSIVGSKNDLITTSKGVNVSPLILETLIKDHPIISNAILVGQDRPFLSILITLDTKVFKVFKEQNNLDVDFDNVNDNLVMRNFIQDIIDEVNQKLSKNESIKNFYILKEDFTEQNSQLNPKGEIIRDTILENYDSIIQEKLYSGK